MKLNMTVRQHICNEIEQQGYSLSQFSQISGINRGVLSATLGDTPTKAMSINQLDRMTKALGKPLNWLYESFITEYLQENNKMNWRRTRSVLIRCVENNHKQGLHKILSLLPTESSYLENLLQLAESLQPKYANVVMPMYDFMIKHERSNHSERLAIAQYRIFESMTDNSIEQNVRAAFIFKPYCYHLPEHLMLDAWLKLANIHFTIQDWDTLMYCGKQLQILSHKIYTRECALREQGLPVPSLQSQRPLVVYYGQSYLIQFTAMELTDNFEQAKYFLSKFTDLSWFEGLDTLGIYEVAKFKVFAKCNSYNLQLLSGDDTNLAQYHQYLKEHPDEVLASVGIMLQAANRYNYNIDHVLNDLESHIFSKAMIDWTKSQVAPLPSHFHIPIVINRYIQVYYELAIYYLNRKRYNKKLEHIIKLLEATLQSYDSQRNVDCLHLLHKLKKVTFEGKSILDSF